MSLGPVALPVTPLLLLAATWAGSWVAGRAAPRCTQPPTTDGSPDAASPAPERAGHALIQSVGIGLLAARLAYLGANADLYLAQPASILDLRDGGWHALAGWLAGCSWLAGQAWMAAPLRRALGAAALTFALVWFGARGPLGIGEAPSLPALPVQALDSGGSAAPASLHDLARGRRIVVNLWASWCGPCRQEMPLLAAAQAREHEVTFLFLDQGESPAAVRAYLSAQGLALREVWLDPAARVGAAVGSRGLPTTLFYDAEGRLVHSHLGVLNAAALEAKLRQLRGRPAAP